MSLTTLKAHASKFKDLETSRPEDSKDLNRPKPSKKALRQITQSTLNFKQPQKPKRRPTLTRQRSQKYPYTLNLIP